MKICEQTFPKNWFKGEVSSINFINKNDPRAWATFDTKNKIINFFKFAQETTTKNNLIALSHELGHANDWENDNETSLEDRLKLLLDITARVESSDHYISYNANNVNLDRSKGEDSKKYQLYRKAKEYWADICSEYFFNPNILNYKDFKLVDDWVQKNDPTFNLEESIKKRDQLLKNKK